MALGVPFHPCKFLRYRGCLRHSCGGKQSGIPGIFVCQHLSFSTDKQNSAISITELLALFQLRWSGRGDTAIHPLDRYISLCFICLGKSECSMARSEEHTSELQSRGHLVC